MTTRSGTALPERFPGRPSSSTLARQMLELARQVSDRRAFHSESALGRALRLAVGLAPGARWATFTASGSGAVPFTSATTGTVATGLDGLQYGFGEGPCLEALSTGSTVLAGDLAAEHRWPEFTAAALRTSPARTVVSYPLALAGQPGTTLNLYGDDPDVLERNRADVLAAAAGAGLVMAAITARQLAENLNRAMISSRMIGAAIGIVMHQFGSTQDEAFTALRSRSQHLHCKLRDVAEEVVRAGELPTPLGDQ